MEQEQDKEIDLLLKRHAQNEKSRLKATFFAEEGNGEKAFGFEDSAHLDADEMNAYAENALPANVRARYAAHLVDCNNCRTLVTRLALSANPTIAETKSEAVANAAAKRSWWKWFSSLLTLPTLRIAGPVAAVLSVAVISVVVWQSGNVRYNSKDQSVSNANQIAQTEERSQAPSFDDGVSATPTSSTERTDSRNTNTNSQQTDRERKSGESQDVETATGGRGSQPSSPSSSPVVGSSAPKKESSSEITTSTDKPTISKDGIETNQPTQIQAQSKTQLAGTRTTEEKRANQAGGPGGPNRAETRDARSEQRPSTTASKTAAPAPVERKADEDKQREAEKTDLAKDDSKGEGTKNKVSAKKAAKAAGPETKTVSGKQFRREENAWVDVAYSSSTATTNISRGSEKYRSLMADEPGLRAIVEQFSGEVIVVWKGRAYRFR